MTPEKTPENPCPCTGTEATLLAMKSSKYPEAAFLSAMTASATHEVRNVLAIIKESAGLVDDLIQVYGTRELSIRRRSRGLWSESGSRSGGEPISSRI